MSWYGTVLDDELGDVLSMVDDLGGSLVDQADAPSNTVEQARTAVVEAGIWALGAPEELGGAGAELGTVLLVLERMGRYWPALGWASAQTQAALTILAAGSLGELAAHVAEGSMAVAVVEADSDQVSIAESGDNWTGRIDRIDVAAERGTVVLLDGSSSALVFIADSLSFEPVRTTGLAGAQTRSVILDSARAERVSTDLMPARVLLRLGAGAIAAGIAGAAADAARDYAINRSQFGGPLTQIPVVRQSLTEQAYGASQAITTVMSSDSSSLSRVTAAMEGALQAAVTVAGQALQSHGGYGYLDEYRAGQFVRDAVSIRAAVDSFSATRQAARSLVDLPWVTL